MKPKQHICLAIWQRCHTDMAPRSQQAASRKLQSVWVWFTFPARAVFDVLMARNGFAAYWETGCSHEFGA